MNILYYILYRFYVFWAFFEEQDDSENFFRAKIILGFIIGLNTLGVLNLVLSAFGILITNIFVLIVLVTIMIITSLCFKNRKIMASRIIFEKTKNKKLNDWLIGCLIILSIAFYIVSLFLSKCTESRFL